MLTEPLDITVVTVTYNGGERILDWARALQSAWSELSTEHQGHLRTLAIDNASLDDTVTYLRSQAPWVEVIPLLTNRGFAAGCNVGFRAAHGSKLLMLLNPDVIVSPDFFLVLARQQWPRDLAALGPSIRTPAGEIEQSARTFPRMSTGLWGRTALLTRLFPQVAARRELQADPQLGRHDIDWVSGACVVIAAHALDRVGMLDEGYFMYWEDADWCRRAHDDGLRIVFEPALQAIHYQGTSSASRPLATTLAFHKSAYRYYRIHLARGSCAQACAAAVLTVRCAAKITTHLITKVAH